MEYSREIEIVSLAREEIALIQLVRKIGYGTVEIQVQDKKPVLVKRIVESYKI